MTDPIAESGLRDLLSRIKVALNDRDEVAHTTWLRTREVIDKPGYIVGQRYRTRGRDEQLWHTDELENVREDLEALTDELSSAAYNAVRPPSEWI